MIDAPIEKEGKRSHTQQSHIDSSSGIQPNTYCQLLDQAQSLCLWGCLLKFLALPSGLLILLSHPCFCIKNQSLSFFFFLFFFLLLSNLIEVWEVQSLPSFCFVSDLFCPCRYSFCIPTSAGFLLNQFINSLHQTNPHQKFLQGKPFSTSSSQ